MGGGTGHSTIHIKSPTGSGKPLPIYNPLDLKGQLLELSKSVTGFSGLVNCLNYLPRGKTSSHGWFLTTWGDIHDNFSHLLRGELKEVEIQFLEEADTLPGGFPPSGYSSVHDFTIKKMLAVKAYAVTGIPEPDALKDVGAIPPPANSKEMLESETTNWRNQFYVVQVVDWRYFAHLSCVTEAYNTRIRLWQEGLATTLYSRSATTGLSWVTLLNDLWGMLPDDMGTLSFNANVNFPSASSTSLNLKFWGVTAWDAFWSLLDQTFHTLIRKYDGTWEVDFIGHDGPSPPPVPTVTMAERTANREDLTSISNDLTATALPETIRVIFPKWDYQWQTSTDAGEVTSKDYWHNRPIWWNDHDTEVVGSYDDSSMIIEGSCHHIHSGVFAQFPPRDRTAGEPDVAPLQDPDNKTTLDALSLKLATSYVDSQTNNSNFRILQEHYRGFIPFTPTKELSSILWGEAGLGPTTRIMNLPLTQEGKFDKDASALGRSGKGGGGAPSAKYDSSASSSQRVVNEFPGAPDHARLDEPVLRWCIAELTAECDPLAQVSALVKYGIPTTTDHDPALAGTQIIKWDNTNSVSISTKSINVNNVSTSITVASGTRVFAAWNEQIRRWVFVPWTGGGGDVEKGGEICARSFGSTAIVGGVHDGERWIWGNGHALVTDYEHDNCIDNLKLLRVNQDTFLRSYRRTTGYSEVDACAYAFGQPVNTEMLISIDPSIDVGGSVFFSDGNKVRWTKSPHIGKEILLGDGLNNLDPPRIKFQHSKTATLSVPAALTDFFEIICRAIDTHLVTGDPPYRDEILGINAKVILPNNTASFSPGQHLSIKSTGADAAIGGGADPMCLKLRWTSPGVTCEFSVSTPAGNRMLYFDDGLLIGVSEAGNEMVLEGADFYRTDHGEADCSYVVYANPDPCAVSHSH